MDSNCVQSLSFDSTPAASVSLACCQSLCDLLKELPLPQPRDQCLSACLSRNQNICQNFSSIDSQLETALNLAKQQLNEIVFNDVIETTLAMPSTMSPLVVQTTLKGLFETQYQREWDVNSLETIEPSIHQQLDLQLMNELRDDCNSSDVTNHFPNEDSYSSLGERVKSRQRVVTTSEVSSPVVDVVSCRENTNAIKVREKPLKSMKNEKCHVMDNNVLNKDSLLSFELILNKLLSDCEEDDSEDDRSDDKNDMSLDLRIDLKDLNVLLTLSSKLKLSNKMKDLEQKVSSKLSSFLSLLTNKMIVWFSKFKETEEYQTTTEDDTQDDNHFWQLLINSSKMALNIMTSRGMSSRVVLFEELLEIVLNFLSYNLNSKTHVTTGKSQSPSKKKSSAVLLTTSATKRQVSHWSELLSLLSEYLANNRSLNDSMVLSVTRIANNSLLLNANEMQLISIQLLSHVFRHYAKHRHSILEDLLSSFHRIPARHKSAVGPHVLTRLLMALTTALFPNDRSAKYSRESLTKQLTECLAVISAFLSQLVKKCLTSSASQMTSEVDFKSLFDAILSDLLNGLFFAQTISSLLLTQIITKLLINYLNPNQKNIPLQLRLNSIEFLANIASRLAKLLSEKAETESETEKTLKQLFDDRRDDKRDDTLCDILKLLNQHFISERLFAEKAILCALWIKEKPIAELDNKFFVLMSTTSGTAADMGEEPIDGTTAQLFIKSLELNSLTTFGRLFDASLSHVTSSLSLTTNTTQRSRAMKSLSQILINCSLEKSTQLLARSDLQIAMRSALLDASTSVREATIDLIGRFVLQSRSQELCEKYCNLIGERILDTGVSVRKRVIKILRDLCIEFPAFAKCGEMQLKIIKRVNDEGEGIRKLVLETVRDLWFRSSPPDVLSYKVMSLLHVIGVMLQTDGSIDQLHQLLEQILKNDLQNAESIIDFIVGRVLLDSSSSGADGDSGGQNQQSRSKALLNLSAVHLVAIFSAICPQFLAKHCDSLQSLLSLSCDSLVDIHLRNKLIQSLEKIILKMANPSQQLMSRLEGDLTKQILQSSAHILPNCVRCLSVVITTHTHNEQLAHDLFSKFKHVIESNNNVTSSKPKLLRSIYSLGLFLKHFHFPQEIRGQVLDHILTLISKHLQNGQNGLQPNSDLICRCITSLGFIVESDPKVCLRPKVIELYATILRSDSLSPEWEMFSAQALQNFRNYLSESQELDEELNKSIQWSRESLKQMTSDDSDSSSVQSQVIQTYLPLLLDRALSASQPIRRVAAQVVHVIQSGGHVHPLQLVPHLIAMTTDDDVTIRSRADHVLHEIERKFHGFVAMKAKAGILLALELCTRLQCRGFRLEESSGDVTSRLATLYHVICTNRQSRRGFIQQLLRSFEINASETTEDDRPTTPTTGLQLMFEMVLFFPFSVFDEVLYISQQLECIQSVNSTNTSHLFTQLFGFQSDEEMDDKFDDTDDTITKQLIEEKCELILCKKQLILQIHSSLQRLFFVSFLRKLLKEFFLLKDEKILEYSPNEPKVWEKPIHRRQIETSNLSEVLLRANPNQSLLREDLKIEELLEEFRRFKSVSLTSNDPKVSNQLIVQKLLTIQKKSPKAITIATKTVSMETPSKSMDDLNETERKRLLESIRRTSCSVSLIDIGIDNRIDNRMEVKRKPQNQTTIKRRKRARISDDSSDDRTSDDDSGDDDNFT